MFVSDEYSDRTFQKPKCFQDINRFYLKSPWSFKYKKPWIEKKQLIICFACFLCFVIVDSDFGDGKDGVRHEKKLVLFLLAQTNICLNFLMGKMKYGVTKIYLYNN